ncbi:MAG: polysaccharide biosynthesis tyrosine autokinase, partial [Cyanothece sp. SIO1E1]|nr:polysaccharide biosynthesis tyrosine autokinase [Cyanothece sp. SIO1E1]
MTDSNLSTATETELGYGQLFSILLRRRFWFLGVLAVVMPVTVFMALRKEPIYQSSLQLLVEPNYEENTRGPEREFIESTVEIDYATQLQLMQSSQLLQRAVDLLKPEYPDVSIYRIRSALSLGQLEDGKDVETKIFQATYISDDPVNTQKVLEAIQKVYQDYNLEQQQLRLQKGLAFINEQLPEARQSVDQAEGALEQFRKNQSLIDPLQAAAATTNAINEIRRERESIRAQFEENKARYNAIQKQLARSLDDALVAARLSQSSRYQRLLNELQETELALTQRRVTYTEADPGVQSLLEQRQSQMGLLRQEISRVLGPDSTQIGPISESLLNKGQLGSTDLNFVNEFVDTRVDLLSLKARDESLAQTEQQLQTELNQLPQLIAEYNRLQPDVEISRNKLAQLLDAQQELGIDLAQGGFNWQVVEPPLPGRQIGPDLKRDILLGAIVGLFLGGVVAFLREALDDSVRTSDQLEQQTALPLLGIIPALPQSSANGFVVSLPDTATSASQMAHSLTFRESLDLVYKNIQLSNTAVVPKSLVITSALAGEGKSTLALGLAMTAARLHQRVLLIDADLRCPSLHQQLDLPNDRGLSTLLAGETNAIERQRVSLLDADIDVLTSGPLPNDPVKLLSSQRMQKLMAMLEQKYDLVLLDTPPILGLVDAIQVASFCRGVVMVARMNQITQSHLTQAIERLKKLNAIGII